MPKFEVGQRVRRIAAPMARQAGASYPAFTLRLGDEATVALVGKSYIELEGYGKYRFNPACFGLVGNDSIPQTATPAGRKDDSGKLDMTLLDDMPRALAAVVEVMQWAVEKKKPVPYERGSWLGVHADRYRAAMKRHDRDACQQTLKYGQARFERDKETKLLHLAHIATSALMALENTIREMEATHAG